jgi:hypothetical protein
MSTVPYDQAPLEKSRPGFLRNRMLRVTFNLPSGDIQFDESLNINVNIVKEALAVQSHATIEISNMASSVRQALMSNLTAFDIRRIQEGGKVHYINVTIEAGYENPVQFGGNSLTRIFKGQVIMCSLTGTPPDITVRLECATNQINKTVDNTRYTADGKTLKEFVYWAGAQMGFEENLISCHTDYDDQEINNVGTTTAEAGALMTYLETLQWPNLAVYVDDDLLIVKNRYDIIDQNNVIIINQFVGIPSWDEWGTDFTAMFNPNVRLSQGVQLVSVMNPGVNGKYVVMHLEHQLSSRDTPFYMKITCCPPSEGLEEVDPPATDDANAPASRF